MSLRIRPHVPGRDRHNPGSLSRRPAVVETDSPQSSSDGRATSPTSGQQPARSAAPAWVGHASEIGQTNLTRHDLTRIPS
jgi:hypothetical protein